MSNESRCLLAGVCRSAGSSACTPVCAHFIAIEGRVKAAAVPAEYRLVTLESSPCRRDQADVYRNLADYVATFGRQFEADGRRIKSLYLYSANPGTGKTTTAIALLHEWIIRHYVGSLDNRRQPDQRPAFFLDVNEFQTIYNRANRSGVPDDVREQLGAEYNRLFEIAKSTPFLVADDIGVRGATDAFRADLHDIINHRTANGKPTVYTSNIPMAELANVFDARLADRVRDMCVEITFSGESKRGIRD